MYFYSQRTQQFWQNVDIDLSLDILSRYVSFEHTPLLLSICLRVWSGNVMLVQQTRQLKTNVRFLFFNLKSNIFVTFSNHYVHFTGASKCQMNLNQRESCIERDYARKTGESECEACTRVSLPKTLCVRKKLYLNIGFLFQLSCCYDPVVKIVGGQRVPHCYRTRAMTTTTRAVITTATTPATTRRLPTVHGFVNLPLVTLLSQINCNFSISLKCQTKFYRNSSFQLTSMWRNYYNLELQWGSFCVHCLTTLADKKKAVILG